MTVSTLFDLTIMTVSSAFGTSTTIPLGSAATVAGVTYLSFSAAGATGGTTVDYSILDPVNGGSEIGQTVYTSSNNTLTSRTPTKSTNGNAAITGSSGALIYCSPRAETLRIAPTRQVLISGTAYTTPANCVYIRIRMIGGGGGGAGSGTGSPGAGGNGGNTTFNTTTTAPGGSGCPAGGQQFGAGGVAGATVDFSIPGGPGGFGVSAVAMAGSGAGGNGAFGGAGPGAPVGNGVAAQAGATNSGSGGGGAGASAASLFGSGGGGGAGAYSELTIISPAASYGYAIGAAGSAGAAGTGGAAGATGAAGIIIVDEYYN